MRGYSWGNMYLSSIQQGIQGWHAQNQIFNKYKLTSPEVQTFLAWNKRHETLVLLNGGYSSNLLAIHNTLDVLCKTLKRNASAQKMMGVTAIPVVRFCEDKDALDGALTAVFTILPESCYCQTPMERQKLLRLVEAVALTPLQAARVGKVGNQRLDLPTRFKLVALCGDLAR